MDYSQASADSASSRSSSIATFHKDYVLFLLFVKYISDKYAGQPYEPIAIPAGASFKDMVALKGTPDIGNQINTKIVAPLASANKLTDLPDFNDSTKLGRLQPHESYQVGVFRVCKMRNGHFSVRDGGCAAAPELMGA